MHVFVLSDVPDFWSPACYQPSTTGNPLLHVGQKQCFFAVGRRQIMGFASKLPNAPLAITRKQTKCEVSWGGSTSGSTCLMLARKGPSCGGLCSQRGNIEVPTLARFCL